MSVLCPCKIVTIWHDRNWRLCCYGELSLQHIRLINPLLSLTTDGHSPNINYNCNLYVDQYRDDDYGEDKTSVNNNSNTSSSKDILDNDNINENNLQEPFMNINETSPQQTNATNWFQVMLHDLVMRNKTSLQMIDGIYNLVNDYTSSPDFSVMSKLQSQKSFLHSIEETYCTHGLRPTNHNVRLHDGSSVTVPVFDTKQMIIRLLTDKPLMTDTILQKDTTYS